MQAFIQISQFVRQIPVPHCHLKLLFFCGAVHMGFHSLQKCLHHRGVFTYFLQDPAVREKTLL